MKNTRLIFCILVVVINGTGNVHAEKLDKASGIFENTRDEPKKFDEKIKEKFKNVEKER